MDRDIAIRNTHSQVVTIRADKYGFDADGNSVDIDESKVNTEMERLQAEYDAQAYSRARASEYPDYREYLDGIVKGDEAQQQKYINDCLAVKAKYPKG